MGNAVRRFDQSCFGVAADPTDRKARNADINGFVLFDGGHDIDSSDIANSAERWDAISNLQLVDIRRRNGSHGGDIRSSNCRYDPGDCDGGRCVRADLWQTSYQNMEQ